MRLNESAEAVARADQALAIAEPRRLNRIIAEAFVNKSAGLGGQQRLQEPKVLMSAAVALAHEVGDVALELRARNNQAAETLFEDVDGALRSAREAYELATRVGIPQMASWLAGSIGWAASHEGLDWDAGVRLLEFEVERARSASDRGRLLAILAGILINRGQAPSVPEHEREWLTPDMGRLDYEYLSAYLPALEALVEGRYAESIAQFRGAASSASPYASDARLGLALAAQYAADLEAAREALAVMADEPFAGTFIDAVRLLAEAGVAGLEGRTLEALDAYRDAVERFRRIGARFEVANVQMAALSMLPGERSIDGWADEARERYEVVKSPPLLERLDEVLAARERARATSGAPTTVDTSAS
jgi:hypothetical protein